MKLIFAFVGILVMFVACDKGAKTPDGLLKKYVEDFTTKKLDREYFEKFTTGKILESVQALTDEEFEKFANTKKASKARVSIINQNCQETKCSITYLVKYESDVNKDIYKSEVKKIAQLVKNEEFWKVADVVNVKTYIEAQQNIEISNEGEVDTPRQ